MLEIVGFALINVLASLAILTIRPQRRVTGYLSRETRHRDRARAFAGRARHLTPRAASERADQLLVPRTDEPAVATTAVPVRREPPTEDDVGVTRRQLFNRSILLGLGLGVGAFGTATVGFLWSAPSKSGFGGKITVGSTTDAQTAFDKKQPFYNATAKTYIVPYPKADLPKARRIAAYTVPIIAGMEEGYVVLYQGCVHLGCRVPWCETSQWFECPCHGSKYSRVGEKRGGPAPRGLDRFVLKILGDNIVVDTGDLVLGPPIGTDTTGQTAEGPACV